MKCRQDRVLVTQAKCRMHLFSIEARRKLTFIRPRPALCEIRVVTLVQFEAADTDVNERRTVIVPKDPPCGFAGKVWHQALPDRVISCMRLQCGKDRRRRMGEGMFPEIHTIAHS